MPWERVWYKWKYDIKQVAQVFSRATAYFKDSPQSQKQEVNKQSGGGGGCNQDPDYDENKRDSSSYKDVTEPGASRTNIETDVTKEQFKKNLKNQGWDKITSKDGKCDIFTKDGAKYVVRDNAKSTESEADAILYNSEIIVWIPDSGRWAIWGQRSCEIAILAFADEQAMNLAKPFLDKNWKLADNALNSFVLKYATKDLLDSFRNNYLIRT